MCGIWGVFSATSLYDKNNLDKSFNKIRHRGPDSSTIINFSNINRQSSLSIGFHRLAIRDISFDGDQPFVINIGSRKIVCVVNGEIYNYKELVDQFKLKDELKSQSDCEIIPILYLKYGIDFLMNVIRGEFAFSIVDMDRSDCTKVLIILARDHLGIRPIFYSYYEGNLMFSSEIKGIIDIAPNNTIKHFEPGTFTKFYLDAHGKFITENFTFYDRQWKTNYDNSNLQVILPLIKKTFKKSVLKMIESDRPIGALLSGGLDSSLVVSIASKYLRKKNKRLSTFSIGMPGSTDKEYAQMVADFCDTDHTHIEFSEKEFLDAVELVIQNIETFDITTVRASVGQYLVSKWISENTNIKVLFIGDGSDELTCGYMYFHKAPTSLDAHNNCCKLLREIHYFDVLRADRGIATNGLEARVPFLDREFVDLYMSISPDLRIPTLNSSLGYKVEKWLLRTAFDNGKVLPNAILWRKKEAFSDGVSSETKSWYQIIQDSTKNEISTKTFHYLPPVSPESLFYRKVYEQFYPHSSTVVPHFWLPAWSNTNEPSARTLDVYSIN